MPKQKIIQTFEGGLLKSTPALLVPHNAVYDCKNMLFEHGEILSRPPIRSADDNLCGAGTFIDSVMPMFPPIAGSSPQVYGTYKTSTADSTMRLFRLQPLFGLANNLILPFSGATVAIPAGLVGGFRPNCVQFGNATYIYGMYDAAGNAILLKIDNITHAATSITLPLPLTTGNAYARAYPIVEHLSRILLADPGIGTISVPTIYWCKIGDPATWTGDFTAGNVRLPEAADGIRALGVLNNVIVVGGPNSFHTGVPTGNGSNPYDWKAIPRSGAGVVYQESFCIYGGMCFFAGQANIYQYDLNTIIPIGDPIADELFSILQVQGLTARMFVTDTYTWKPRPQLHVVPTYTPTTYTNGGTPDAVVQVNMTQIPHYVHDLIEKKWSRHFYDEAAADIYAFEGFAATWDSRCVGIPNTGTNVTFQRPALIRRKAGGPSRWMMWDPYASVNGCESTKNFSTGTFVVGDDPTLEFKLDRFMILIRMLGSSGACSCDVIYVQGNTVLTDTVNFTVQTNGVYSRYWLNKVLVGNLFRFIFNFPASSEVHVRTVVFEFDERGQEVRVENS